MEDYRELFKKELDRLSYLYSRANTKSKKRQMAYDLIFFEDMYNNLSDKEKTIFPWTYDEVIVGLRIEVIGDMIKSVLENQLYLVELIKNSFNIFLENEFSVHADYGKRYHKISNYLMQKTIIDMFSEIDKSSIPRFRNKFDNSEIFVNNNIKGYAGLFFPMEALSKNIIFITAKDDMSTEEGRILAHEIGHDFEFENASKNGVTSIWSGIVRTIFPEVSSSFFEYAYINYLIENNIYKEDAMRLRRKYLNQIYEYLCYLLIIFHHKNLNVDLEFNIKLDKQEIVDYANELLEMMNSSDRTFKLNDKLNFRIPFIYGISKLLGVYIYDAYKNNPKEFLSNFKTALLQYKHNGIDAFNRLGITRESLIDGKVLKKILNECK